MDTASRRLRYTVSGTPGQHAAGPVPYVISRRFLRNMRLLELLSAGRLWKTLRPRSARYIALRVRPVRTKNVDRRARAVLLRVPGFIHHPGRARRVVFRGLSSELWTRGLELDSRPDTRIGRILADSIRRRRAGTGRHWAHSHPTSELPRNYIIRRSLLPVALLTEPTGLYRSYILPTLARNSHDSLQVTRTSHPKTEPSSHMHPRRVLNGSA